MGSVCSSLRKKDRRKSSIDNGAQIDSERRCSNKSVESLPYGIRTSPISERRQPVEARSSAAGAYASSSNKSAESLPYGTRTSPISERRLPVEARSSTTGASSSIASQITKDDNHLCALSVTPSPLPSSQTPSPFTTPSTNRQLPVTSSGLPNLGKFSIESRNLLIGQNLSDPNSLKPFSKEFFIYLITNDMGKYKKIVEKALPDLERPFIERGYQLRNYEFNLDSICIHFDSFHDLDDVCMKTLKDLIDNKHVIPLVIIDDTKVCQSLPYSLEFSVFETLLEKLGTAEAKDLLRKYYYLDENHTPLSYCLVPLSARYSDFQASSQQNRRQHYQQWCDESQTLIEKLSSVESNLMPSIEEQQLNLIVSRVALAKQSIFIRQGKLDSLVASGPLKTVVNKFDELVLSGHKLVLTGGDDECEIISFICDQVKKFTESACEEELSVDNIRVSAELGQPLYIELMNQLRFRINRESKFIGRESYLNQIQSYLVSNSTYPLIIHGPCGNGKSALMSKVSFETCLWLPSSVNVFRSVRVSLESRSLPMMLRSLCEQCSALYGVDIRPAEVFDDLEKVFDKIFEKCNEDRPLVLMIDGIEQLQSSGSQALIDCLSKVLPVNVKLIVSLSDGDLLKELRKKFSDECFLCIDKISTNELVKIFDSTLNEKKRKLSDDQKAKVVEMLKSVKMPFYARLLGKYCQRLSHVDPVDDLTSISAIIECDLDDLCQMVGENVLLTFLISLESTKYGASASEIRSIVEMMNRKMDSSLWSLLTNRLEQYLLVVQTEGESLATLNGGIVEECVKIYGAKHVELCELIRRTIEKFYAEESLIDGIFARDLRLDLINQWPNRRKFMESIAVRNLDSHSIGDNLHNWKWLLCKLLLCDPFELLEDLDQYLKNEAAENRNELAFMFELIKQCSYALRYQSSQVLSQFYSRLESLLCDEKPKIVAKFLRTIVGECAKPILTSLLPINTRFMSLSGVNFGSVELINAGNGDESGDDIGHHYDMLFNIKDDDQHVIALSCGRGEVSVWNVIDGKPVRVLRGINQPRDIQLIDKYRAVVLCNRDLKIYNLDRGELEIKLKGVMNQQMPFFGLHNENYLVALSRNRMYVNLQSLKTGDVETTFKVGEDRFLNSLLVSADGSYCVCGDETQKPFPLLVWDLAYRKLVYDLRIPSHEFITRLSTISDDGHFVACVSKELNSSSPNFIVVYDLQSGTLFKKWKPDCNTMSIAISSQSSYVVNCIETCLILVWDLSTGARRLTLRGHTSPVDKLQFSGNGKTLLSYDSTSKDRSIRLWNLENGTCLSTFTPDVPLSCCQLSANGKMAVICLNNKPCLHTLILCHRENVQSQLSRIEKRVYGDEKETGKIYDLSKDN